MNKRVEKRRGAGIANNNLIKEIARPRGGEKDGS